MRKSVVIGLCIVGAAIVVAKSRKRTPVSTTVSPIVPTVDSEIIFEIIPSDDITLTDDPNFDDDFFAEPENWLDPTDDLDDTELVGVVAAHDAGNGKETNVDLMRCIVKTMIGERPLTDDPFADCGYVGEIIDTQPGYVMQIGESEPGYVMQIGHHRSEPIDPIVGRCIGYMADLVNGDAYYDEAPFHLPYGISRFDGGIEMTWAWKLYAGDHEDILHRDWLEQFQAALQNEGHMAVVHGDTLLINCPAN